MSRSRNRRSRSKSCVSRIQVQAAAFRAAQTQLPTTIRAIAGTRDNGANRNKQSAGDRSDHGKERSPDQKNRRGVANSEDENLRAAKVAPEEPPEKPRKAHHSP
jgi:hypothetical protein